LNTYPIDTHQQSLTNMKTLKDKVVVITGAASGIGQNLAKVFAEQGSHLFLNDYDPQGLEGTVQELRKIVGASQQIESMSFDVSDKEKVQAFADQAQQTFGKVDVVINNAGVALGRLSAEEVSYEDFEWIMGINFWGMVYGSKAFLPLLKQQPEAALVNVSSVFGLAGIAFQSAYCTTKFAIRGFTESLRMEALMMFPHVTIHTVHPGGINTNIAKNSRWDSTKMSEAERNEFTKSFQKSLKSSPYVTAQQIVKSIQRKKSRILVGSKATLLDRLVRLFPGTYSNTLLKNLKKEGVKLE